MNIFYDHQAFSAQNYGGVSRIFSELITGIPLLSKHSVHLPMIVSNNIYLSQKRIPHISFLPSVKIPRKQGIIYKLNQLYNTFDIKKTHFDIYHPSYYDPALIKYAKGKPVVATFHDMTHEKLAMQFPELSKERSLLEHKKQIAERADHIIAVSNNTKKDLIEILKVPAEKISVVYLGNSFSQDSKVSKNDLHPYLLFVGNRGSYKNFIYFLRSVTNILIRYKVRLVCAGSSPFTNEELGIIRDLSVQNFVSYKFSNSDQQLAELYSNAIAFVFPSLYEGFGIPVLEAFACNCPCIISNTSSLPEVAKDAAIYFDPANSFSIANAVEKVINNTEFRHDLIRKGQERLKAFSWNKHVQETIEVYEKF
jgi:glycosyltransferase involved in cell wall biosynthesis